MVQYQAGTCRALGESFGVPPILSEPLYFSKLYKKYGNLQRKKRFRNLVWVTREMDLRQLLTHYKGLALSGGVDSMALAYLCRAVMDLPHHKRDGHSFQYFPLIVDHKAREGSTEEALLVAKRLRKLLGEY